MTTSEFHSRIQKVSDILKVMKPEEIKDALNTVGISDDDFGFQLLEAETTDDNVLASALQEKYRVMKSTSDAVFAEGLPEARLRAATAILKGRDPFSSKKEGSVFAVQTAPVEALSELIRNNIPLQNRKDKDLLDEFIREEDLSVQQELDKRANGKPFIVLNETGKIIPEISLDLLKRARRGEDIPDMIPIGADRANVYPIQRFKLENRIKDESPLVPGATLMGNYCRETDEDFGGISQEARQFIRLVVEFTNTEGYKKSKFHSFRLDSYSDKKALMSSARKGIEDLKKTWPSVARIFYDKQAAGTLPSLKIEVPIATKKDDPFYPGKRTVHQEY